MQTTEEILVKTLSEKKKKIATAESCTGGMLSQLITNVSGASGVFECGICSYSNRVKIQVLGVNPKTIERYTEVSTQTAEEMARGVLEISEADIAVSTTGIAGPTGGTEENPVGTVCIGFAFCDSVISEKKNFNLDMCNDRSIIRRRCAEYCLKKAAELVSEKY